MKPQYWLYLALFFALGTVIRIITFIFASGHFGDIFNILLGAAITYLTWRQYKKEV